MPSRSMVSPNPSIKSIGSSNYSYLGPRAFPPRLCRIRPKLIAQIWREREKLIGDGILTNWRGTSQNGFYKGTWYSGQSGRIKKASLSLTPDDGEISILKECYNKHLYHPAHLNGKLIDLIGSNLFFFFCYYPLEIWLVSWSLKYTCDVFLWREKSQFYLSGLSQTDPFLLYAPSVVRATEIWMQKLKTVATQIFDGHSYRNNLFQDDAI